MPTFETNQPVVLSIEMSRGAVHVIAGDRADTVVAVNPSDRDRPEDVEAAAQTVVDLADGTVSVRGPKSLGVVAHLVGWRRGGSVDVTVELPEGSSLRADTGLADVRGDGRLADVEVKTGAGHVAVEEASGSAEIVTAGDVTIGAVAGDADVEDLNGGTWIGRVGGTVKVRSANGDVTIEEAGGDVTVTAATGNIRLGVGEGTAARVDAATKFGRVRNELTSADGPGPSAETVEVRARTSFGDVVIARSSVPTRQGGR
jgi:DUF4097 and DUF4098 domain-containing protein YvlB